MTLQRTIASYEKLGEKFIEEIEIDIPVSVLKEIFTVDEKEDPEMYYCYKITETELAKLIRLDHRLSRLDLNTTELSCECCSID